MKRLLLSTVFVLSILFASCITANAAISQFLGSWTNINPNSSGLTQMEIKQAGSSFTVQVWGSATPSDIDWGIVPAYAYADNVSANPTTATAMTALYGASFKNTILVIKAMGPRLQVETLTRFTDNSGRTNYHSTDTFIRKVAPVLTPPVQLQPNPGAVFSHYPRTTTVVWQPVQGATGYTVQIDYFDSSWVSDRGQNYIIASNINTTSYTFNFVGAQPGRWRVWAIGQNGVQGPKSAWREFRYTR